MKKFNILVVDDEQDLCDILKFNLENEGYSITTANSGEEALSLIRKNKTLPDLMLLDIMMGGISGLNVAKTLKGKPDTRDIPIIFITAKDTEHDTIAGFDTGADDYIAKPFSIRECVARVNAVLRRAARTATNLPSTIKYRGIAIDTETKQTTIDGNPITLTKTEYNLLLLLMRNPQQLFSRQQIIDEAWKDVIVTGRTIDVNITRLRKKIAPYSHCIVTRPGFGYSLEA